MSWNNNVYAQEKDSIIVNSETIDKPIYYSAEDSLYTDVKKSTIHLFGNAKIDNGDIRLNAGYIMVDLNKNEVLATYSLDKDSNMISFPVFTEGSEEIKAKTIRYNFTTEKAYIEEVAIQQDEIFLYMGEAKKHANDQIHFKKGRFTTCDLIEPHYHFQLSKAVMIPGKRIVSGPMNLWVKGVPTPLGLPFSIIPQSETRTSGFLFPELIPSSIYGTGLQNLGYYIPINDRLQTTIYGSLYSRGSWGLSNKTDYYKRYGYKGFMDIGFQQFKSGFPENLNRNKFSVKWTHKTDAKSSPYWNFSSNVNFISDNNSQNSLDPLNPDYFKNSFNSDINLNRNFPGKPISMGAKISLRQNSQTSNVSLASPVINVNVSRFFPLKNLVKGKSGWGELIKRLGVTYQMEGQNKVLFADTLLRDKLYSKIGDQFLNGINQRLTLQTTAGLFQNTWKLTPSVRYGNKINFQQIVKSYDVIGNTTITDTVQKMGSSQDVSLTIQLTTAVYSYYQFIGKRKPILRHVLTPSFGFSYMPNLNSSITENIGVDETPLTYSPFERSLYSSSTTQDRALLTFGFNNTFELKTKSEKDTTDGFKRTRIIDALSFTGNYDFMKDSMNLSDININLRVSPFKWINFVATSKFSPYGWIDSTGATTSEYAIKQRNEIGRLLRSNLTTTITFTSKESRDEIDATLNNIGDSWNADFQYYMLHPEFALNFNIPWKFSLSHVYSINTNTSISTLSPDKSFQVQTIMLTGDVSFTKRWKVSTVTNFDLQELKVTNARFSLIRDLHCWALAFHWTPIGGNQSFLFTIRNTSNLFKDAKIDFRKPPAFL